MEIQARIILLIIGCIILAGVAYDFLRRRGGVKRVRVKDNNVEHEIETIDDVYQQHHLDMEFAMPETESFLDFATEAQAEVQAEVQEQEYVQERMQEPERILPLTNVNVISITVLSRKPGGFRGAELYRALNKADCHYTNHIFYRYAGGGAGEQLFCVVQAVEPGIFDIEQLPDLLIPGITFIMQPDHISDKEFALDQMVRVAKQMAFVLNGELLDHKRQPLTLETIAKYQTQIRTK